MEAVSLPQLAVMLSLIPLLMLILSAGIAWGVTKATVSGIKDMIKRLDNKVCDVNEDLNAWKLERNNAVVTYKTCSELRKTCASEQHAEIQGLVHKFEAYARKSDERWERLLLSFNIEERRQKKEGD